MNKPARKSRSVTAFAVERERRLWLAGLTFLAAITGWLIAEPSLAADFPGHEFQLNGLMLAVFASLALIQFDLFMRPLRQTMWAWMFVFIFATGYFFKAFYFASIDHPSSVTSELAWLDTDTILQGLRWTTLAFVMFCLTAKVLFLFRVPIDLNDASTAELPAGSRSTARRAVVASMVCMAVYGVLVGLRSYLDIAAMGQATVHTTLRLDSIVSRAEGEIVPAALLTLAWACDRVRAGRGALFVTALFFLVGASEAAVSTSRGTLFMCGILVFVLWSLTGKMRSGRLGSLR